MTQQIGIWSLNSPNHSSQEKIESSHYFEIDDYFKLGVGLNRGENDDIIYL